jgi:hypothetical protein
MEDFNMPNIAKIDCEAPSFSLPYYDPKKDEDSSISLSDLK